MKRDKDPPSSSAFPTRLFAMLEESPKRGFEDVIAWQPGGESFRVFKPDRFAAEIAGDFFALRKYKSFLRQLNIYGFQRIHHGPNKGGYCHPLFKRSNSDLCKIISRQGESQRAPAVATTSCGIPRQGNGVMLNASEENRFEEEVRARFPNKLDESVLDPVRLLFSLCSSSRVIDTSIPGPVTSSDGDNGTTIQQDYHGSFDTLNSSTGITTASKEQEHSFPWKLHTLLEEAEREGFTNIVSWVQDGTAFKVHDSDAFVNRIMPNFFDQSKYESFRRQLNLYGFTRITRGANKGYISHPCFIKNNRSMCKRITRKGKDDVVKQDTFSV